MWQCLWCWQGTADEVVDLSHGKQLWELCKEKYEPLWVKGGNHCNLELYPEYLRHLRKFISAIEKMQNLHSENVSQQEHPIKTPDHRDKSRLSTGQREKSRHSTGQREKPRLSTDSREKSRSSTDRKEKSRRSFERPGKARNSIDQSERGRNSIDRSDTLYFFKIILYPIFSINYYLKAWTDRPYIFPWMFETELLQFGRYGKVSWIVQCWLFQADSDRGLR